MKFVSIIIPTYNEWDILTHCLHALSDQTYPKEMFEIIIVNNNPDDPPSDKSHFPSNCSVITETKPGSYAARNAGLKIARGEVIGFTDSDCIPDKNWITNAMEYFKDHESCSRIAGNILIMFKGSSPTIVEMYNQIYAFPQQWLIANGGGSITGNLFTYKHIFDKVGYFDENLMSMGDVAWGKLAHKAGFNVDYVENVVVSHPSRSMKALIKKEKRHGGGAARMINKYKALPGILHLVYQLRPRINALRFMLGRRKGLRLKDRILIPLLRYYLLNIRAYEKFKVMKGKLPNRA